MKAKLIGSNQLTCGQERMEEVTYWYCPPLEGNAEASSASPTVIIEQATNATTGVHTPAGAPPNDRSVSSKGTTPVQEFMMAKEKANSDIIEKRRGSSPACP